MTTETTEHDESTDDTPRDGQSPIEAVRSLPWVVRVTETASRLRRATDGEDNDDSVTQNRSPEGTHAIETREALLRVDYEFHELENCGVHIESVSTVPEIGSRFYVSV